MRNSTTPNALVKKWAKDAGKSVEEVEKIWSECEEQASKKIDKDDKGFYGYVNVCVRGKLGLLKEAKEELGILGKW